LVIPASIACTDGESAEKSTPHAPLLLARFTAQAHHLRFELLRPAHPAPRLGQRRRSLHHLLLQLLDLPQPSFRHLARAVELTRRPPRLSLGGLSQCLQLRAQLSHLRGHTRTCSRSAGGRRYRAIDAPLAAHALAGGFSQPHLSR
jgi:hypothetical protein